MFEDAQVNVRKLWTAAYAEAKVPKGTRMFYSLRHAFATEMANSGMPMPALARLLGRSSVDMTFRITIWIRKHSTRRATFELEGNGQWLIRGPSLDASEQCP